MKDCGEPILGGRLMLAVAGGGIPVRCGVDFFVLSLPAALRLVPDDVLSLGVGGCLGAAPYFSNSCCVEL